MTGVIEQYTKTVKPAFDQFVAPSRKYADVIIPWARWGDQREWVWHGGHWVSTCCLSAVGTSACCRPFMF